MRIIIIASALFIIIIFITLKFRGWKNRFPWYEFYSKGKKEGFTFNEISFLRKISVQNKLEKPQSIFWSTRQLDRCLKPAIQKINVDDDMDPDDKLSRITKLLSLRTKAEFSLPKYQKRIRDTTALLPKQKLIIREKEYGAFFSWVIEINRKNLVVTQPAGQKGWETLNWVSKKIDVYFWRKDDAGYEIETKVQDQITHEEYPLLYLAHSSHLKRVQKRKSIRIETYIPTQFNTIVYSTVDGVNKAFLSKRFHTGRIIDLSEGGCCMLAGSLLKKNDKIKLDFLLTEEKRIVAIGIIVNVLKTGDERVKKYNVMFVKIDRMARNNILLYVYNIFGERTDEELKRGRKVEGATPASKKGLPAY